MSDAFIDTFAVPGSKATLTFERASSGQLLRLSAGTRVYFAEEEGGEKTYGEGLGHVREVALENGIVRHVRAAGQAWIEEYLWDELGRPLRIDGVEIERDEKRRVVACGEWRYAYAGEDLVVIGTPHGVRHVTRGIDGRPVGVRNGHGAIPIRYRDDGARSDVAPLPATWHRDSLGRLWTICDAHGRVETTFLWNGFSCIGRIDGDAGAPLAAFFSLDPSSTPVRVVTANGMTRIPRDAFGESLLAHDRVPGLYGGAIHDGFVHLRSRAVDPRCGSFDRRDPLHGRDDDPRRVKGFDGPLPIEDPPCGPYAVCQYDPVGRIDPTGEASGFQVGMGFLYTILDATWALQHNTAGLFGLDMTLGLLSSIFKGNFFDFEPMYNDRTGVWAMRRGIFGLERGFVYQHIVTVPAERFNALSAVSVIVPEQRFEPTLYGTLLHVAPKDFPPLLLRGNRDFALAGWSRSGGAAEAIAPGSPVPRFPLGGLHFDSPRDDIRGPLDGDITELVPTGTPLLATVDAPRVATTVPFDDKLEADQVVLLSDGAGKLDIKTIAEVDDKHASKKRGRRVRFTEPGIQIAQNGVRLRVLGESKESDKGLTSPAPKHIDIFAGAVEYKKDDLLRFTQDGTVVGAAIVDAFETQIVLDSGAPAGFAAPLDIRVAVAAGKGKKGKLDGIKLKTTRPPSKGEPIVLVSGAQKLAAVVAKELAADEVELDRTAAELTPLGADVTWKPLISGTKLSRAASLPAGATLSYTPEVLRQAPDKGFVLLRDASKPMKSAARIVTARNYDAIVVQQDLPGDATKPYDIEVFPIKKPDIEKLNLQLDPRIKLSGSPAPAIGAKALQLVQLSTPVVTAGGSPLAAVFSGKEATMVSVGSLEPSQFVVLSGGGAVQPNVITRISAAIELDRQLALNATDPIDVIAIENAGPAYDADAIDATHVVVHATSGGNALQFPRFEKSAIVEAFFTRRELYVVEGVEGTTLTLKEGPPDAAIAAAAHGTIQLVVPVKASPSNETWRIGMNGKAVAAGATTNRITADIWNAAHVSNSTRIALVQNKVTHVAKVNTAPAFVVHFLAASSVGNAVDVTTTGDRPSTTAVFTQNKEFVTLADVTGPALVTGPNAVVVIAYGAGTSQSKMEMTSGTVRVPEDAEKFEIDRRKALVYHELTHTRQTQQLGPLMYAFFPLFALEGLYEGATDVELPKFSQYVGATITVENDNRFLAIPDPKEIDFEEETKVQVEQSGAHLIALGAKNGNRFLISGGGELVAGEVQVRRLTDDGGWGTLRDVTFNILSGATIGGLTNYVAGTVWGGFLFGLFKLIYFLSHRLGKAGSEHPATVVDSRTVRMTTDAGRLAIQGYNEVFLLKGGEREGPLNVERIDNDTITLEGTTSFTGDIAVNPYGGEEFLLSTVVDTLTYFNATVPDPAKPAQILVQKNGDDELKLKPFDRVSIAAGATSRRTNVTAAVSGGLFELEEAPLTFGADRALRIAYVDENDPMGSADSQLLTYMGMGWMRSLFDPWRQIHFGLDPKPGSASDWLARFARYAFSSHSWSMVIPGWGFWDNVNKQRKKKGHLSRLEQTASNESGHLYSPLAKIRCGFADGGGHGQKKARVGDIAHYWFTPEWEAGFQPLLNGSSLDEPGPGMERGLIEVLPEVGAESAGAPGAINKGATSTAARPGAFVPDAFYLKSAAADPESATGQFKGMLPSIRGFIPPTPQLQLSLGHYVAFTQPGKHRVTVSDDIFEASVAREAHDEGRQTIFFDVTVSDVTVKVGSTVITRKTPPDEVKLLPGQRALLKVDSDDEWVLTAEQPGKVVSIGADGKSLTMDALVPGASETLEVSRVYPFPDGKYADEVLSTHGVNLPVPIHVPVRQFKVAIRDTFEFVGELKADAAPVASVKPGQTVYAFIPTRIPPGARLTPAFAFAVGSPPPDPVPVITEIPTPAALSTFIGAGKIFQVDFSVDDPPEEPVKVTFTINIGPGAGVPVTAKLDYTPHFQLLAGSFEIAQNANGDLISTAVIAQAFVADGLPGAKVAVAVDGKSVNVRVATRAPEGKRRILAISKTDPMKRALRTISVPVLPAEVTFDATFEDVTGWSSKGLSVGDISTDQFLEPAPSTAISVVSKVTNIREDPPGVFKGFQWGDVLLDTAVFAPKPPAAQKDPANATLFQHRLLGRVCYPSVAAHPGEVAGATPVPVVAILHGNHSALNVSSAVPAGKKVMTLLGGGTVDVDMFDITATGEVGNHLGYEYLQRELAKYGIASISVDTNIANFKSALLQSRTDMLLETLDVWKGLAADPASKFHGKLDFNRVGLVGHSRGGDAVVRAVVDNAARVPAERFGITAVCSLSPTDFTGSFKNAMELKRDHKITYLVVYGSLDNDVAGRALGTAGAFAAFTGTGFRLYDRASCDKAMVFVKDACHNRFNTNWGTDSGIDVALTPELLSEPDHLEVSKFYIGGFFRWQFTGEALFERRYTGVEPPPAGVTTSPQWSFGDEVRRVDTFEKSDDNELGEERTVKSAKVLRFGEVEVNGVAEGPHVPHQTRILDAKVTGSVSSRANVLKEPMPTSDWSGSRFLTFRIGRWFDLDADPFVGAQPRISVTVKDDRDKEAKVVEGAFFTADVPGKPFRHKVGAENLTFHRLETVRIPLSLFAGIDLHRVRTVLIDVGAADNTHVFLDSLEVVRL